MKTDYLIVGAGLAGLTLAERLTSRLGRTCIALDKKAHVGGNCYDEYDRHGVLTHVYGPHYFRTNSVRIFAYLSQFTEWINTTYRVVSFDKGKY